MIVRRSTVTEQEERSSYSRADAYSPKEEDCSFSSLITTIKALTRELSRLCLLFLLAICLLGGGRASKNGWVRAPPLSVKVKSPTYSRF